MSVRRTMAERAEQVRAILESPLYAVAQTSSLDAPANARDPEGATLADALPDPRPTAEEIALDAERRALLARRLRTLTPGEQVILALRFAGWSYPEVAVVVGRNRNAVAEIEREAHARIGAPANEPDPAAFTTIKSATPAELLRRQREIETDLGDAGIEPARRLALHRERIAIEHALRGALERERARQARRRRIEYLDARARRGDLLDTERSRIVRELAELRAGGAS